ncbi:hypothetical protein [Mucilaginibacter jinjuensis]|uniref:Uncharacterized protein n=1 Tax=Mucilaginibacter jinjuensis TaxID=1176721 RepID=A0ABY7TF44_9SPHI|nr:hypothetical protein [Mucilaginibacter jinjuensis]WCT14936.1 hypothetical protein PQO05_13415 [Mucilaginibacter jinjuensis]
MASKKKLDLLLIRFKKYWKLLYFAFPTKEKFQSEVSDRDSERPENKNQKQPNSQIKNYAMRVIYKRKAD